MKRRELERKIKKQGWWFLSHGGDHDIWTNGDLKESIPRHPTVGEGLSKKILTRMRKNPPPKGGQ